MNVHETLEQLENLDVFSEDDLSEDEYFIARRKLVILPPNDESDRDTDEDSRDENQLLPNNLNRNQLLAGATADLRISSGNISLSAVDEEDIARPSVNVS